MKAATIAEVYITEDAVRVELEIGVTDLPAFESLLPNEIRERMGLPSRPLDERLEAFFRNDLRFVADGRILPGEVLQMKARRRVPRDDVTGEPETLDVYYPGTEDLGPDEMRVVALGTGMPSPRPKQAARVLAGRAGQRRQVPMVFNVTKNDMKVRMSAIDEDAWPSPPLEAKNSPDTTKMIRICLPVTLEQGLDKRVHRGYPTVHVQVLEAAGSRTG